jgi:hypothetical protein
MPHTMMHFFKIEVALMVIADFGSLATFHMHELHFHYSHKSNMNWLHVRLS